MKNVTTIWITGLSGSGKTTLANTLHKALLNSGIKSIILDGDQIRETVNKDLKFSLADREENNRRVAEMAKLINDSGLIVICALISPTNRIRQFAKEIIGADNFCLVYVNTSIETCMLRDTKSLYKQANAGRIKNFTGISSTFEIPDMPHFIVDGCKSVDDNSAELLASLLPYSFQE